MKHVISISKFIAEHSDHAYARFVLTYLCLPQKMRDDFQHWMQPFELFCTYQGKRYRCMNVLNDTQLSLTDSLTVADEGMPRTTAHIAQCSDWSSTPELPKLNVVQPVVDLALTDTKIPHQKFFDWERQYLKDPKGLRYGESFMQTFFPKVADSELITERRSGHARSLIVKRYVRIVSN